MKISEQEAILAMANIIELGTRVLQNVVGEELSTKVDGQEVSVNAETMIASNIRARLETKEV